MKIMGALWSLCKKMGALWTFCKRVIPQQSVKFEIQNLLCCAITCDPDNEITKIRASKLRSAMAHFREASRSWDNILQSSLDIPLPCSVRVYLVLRSYGSCKDGVTLWILCTFVTDMCVLSLTRGEQVDVAGVINVLVSFLFKENDDLCVNFLQSIDAM